MGKAAPEGLVYGCITHVPLWIEYPSYVIPIYMGDAQGPGRLNLRDLAPEWAPYHPILGGTAGGLAFRNYVVKNFPHAKQVGICSYRKFLSRERIGVSDPHYQLIDVISNSAL